MDNFSGWSGKISGKLKNIVNNSSTKEAKTTNWKEFWPINILKTFEKVIEKIATKLFWSKQYISKDQLGIRKKFLVNQLCH